MKKWTTLAVLCALAASATSAGAKVTAEQAAKLGDELTPVGAIRAGNAEGTIPAWDGGITSAPAGYQPGDHHPDPFVGDEPLFRITAQNLDQYRDQLSPGQIAMFERYPETWFMHVFPTRRSASFPQRAYDAALENATNAELTEGGNGVRSSRVSWPFPIPQNGNEAIWNHLMRYRGQSIHRTVVQATPLEGGNYVPVVIDEHVKVLYAQPGATTASIDNKLAYFLQEVQEPARLAGQILLVHETLDQTVEPRKAWVYNAGQRRVRRAPNVAYDNPGTASDGQRTNDQLDMFNGAPDRYDWELKGRREMFVPYNNYTLHSDELKHDDIVMPGHINPAYLRYELHRVWEVDAKVKDGTSHVYDRRTFFLDEDSWQAMVVDCYDARGQIWRVSEAYVINYYDVPILWDTLQCHYDLQNGRYLAFGLNNELPVDEFGLNLDDNQFTPAALRRMGRR